MSFDYYGISGFGQGCSIGGSTATQWGYGLDGQGAQTGAQILKNRHVPSDGTMRARLKGFDKLGEGAYSPSELQELAAFFGRLAEKRQWQEAQVHAAREVLTQQCIRAEKERLEREKKDTIPAATEPAWEYNGYAFSVMQDPDEKERQWLVRCPLGGGKVEVSSLAGVTRFSQMSRSWNSDVYTRPGYGLKWTYETYGRLAVYAASRAPKRHTKEK